MTKAELKTKREELAKAILSPSFKVSKSSHLAGQFDKLPIEDGQESKMFLVGSKLLLTKEGLRHSQRSNLFLPSVIDGSTDTQKVEWALGVQPLDHEGKVISKPFINDKGIEESFELDSCYFKAYVLMDEAGESYNCLLKPENGYKRKQLEAAESIVVKATKGETFTNYTAKPSLS